MRRSLRVWLVIGALLSCGGCFWLVVDDDLHDRGGRGGHGGDDRGGDRGGHGGGHGGGSGRH